MERLPPKNKPIPNKKPISNAALRIKEAREKYKKVGKDPYLPIPKMGQPQ